MTDVQLASPVCSANTDPIQLATIKKERIISNTDPNRALSVKVLVSFKEWHDRIQILCRRYPFWSYHAGLTIADPQG